MLKKFFALIFLITVFLSFDNQIKAMQESDLESTSEKTELQLGILHCEQEICRILSTTDYAIIKDIQQISPSLQVLAASAYLKTLQFPGQELDSLGTDVMSENLKAYCKLCHLIPRISSINHIHKHIASIKQHITYLKSFKQYIHSIITKEDIYSYNKLLHELLYSIDIQDINMEAILSAINAGFKPIIKIVKLAPQIYCEVYTDTFKAIKMVLQVLMQSADVDFSGQNNLTIIWDLMLKEQCTDLLKLLAKNKKLLPPLNHIGRGGNVFFTFLIKCNIDTNLFKSIIDEENICKGKNEEYSWEKFFTMILIPNRSRLDYSIENNIKTTNLKVILELMKRKDLIEKFINGQINRDYTSLMAGAAQFDDGFINEQITEGDTPLMLAAQLGNDEIIQLLINYGADINFSNTEGKRAIDYAIELKDKLVANGLDVDPESLKKVDRCIELLTPKRTCLLQ